jgi:hypothetical protein
VSAIFVYNVKRHINNFLIFYIKMIKSILYTSNPNFVPTTLEQVSNFAEENGKFLTCFAKEGSELYSVEEGAHILSSKGNHIYILETGDDYSWAKKSNIVGIVQMDYPFGNTEKPIVNTTTSVTKNTIAGFSDRLKETFMPIEAKDIHVSMDGNICVATNQGYVAIDAQNHLIAYPEEFTLKLPVFIISKPKENLVVGDIIALDHGYAKVTSIKGEKINAISYTGAGKLIRTIKDFVFNQTMVRVVVSLAGNMGGQMNPMMLMALADKKDDSLASLLPLMMMNQQGGAVAGNPMMFALLAGKDGLSIKDMLMMSMMRGNNPFGNMFGTVQAPIQVAPEKESTEKDIED